MQDIYETRMNPSKVAANSSMETDLGAYLREIEQRHRRAVAAIKGSGEKLRWRARLRVRMGVRLGVDAAEYKTKFRRRVVTICSRKKGEALKDAEWLIFMASRFETAKQALEFGRSLQLALSTSAAISRYSIDVGADNVASAKFGNEVKEALAKEGQYLFDDVHGLDVIPDTPASFAMVFGATITVSTPPEMFFDGIQKADDANPDIGQKGIRAALLLNAATMAEHPVGRLILSVAAIELLASREKWSLAQKNWIRETRERIRADEKISSLERGELEKAIEGMFRFSVRESTKRLLTEIGCDDRLDEWETLYSGRSRLVHADKHFSYADLVNLASSALDLCPEIFKAYVNGQS